MSPQVNWQAYSKPSMSKQVLELLHSFVLKKIFIYARRKYSKDTIKNIFTLSDFFQHILENENLNPLSNLSNSKKLIIKSTWMCESVSVSIQLDMPR